LTAYAVRVGFDRNEGRGKVLMQLADEAVATSRLGGEGSAARLGANKRSSVACRRDYPPVPVAGLNRRAVKDQKDQQQSDAPRKGCVIVFE